MPTGIFSFGPFDYQLNKVDEKVPAFTIIRQRGDNLQTTLPILHMGRFTDNYDDEEEEGGGNERRDERPDEVKRKGSRRGNDVRSMMTIGKSSLPNDGCVNNGNKTSCHLELAKLQDKQTNPLNKKEYSKSHDNLFGLSQVKRKGNFFKSVMSLSTENFNDILNAKLENCEKRAGDNMRKCEKCDNKIQKNTCRHRVKKPFITTVKSGEFLMPPPEVAALIGISSAVAGVRNGHEAKTAHNDHHLSRINKFRQFINSGRRPEVRYNKHNARCQAAANEPADHQQPPSFGNIMYDRRVVRGSTFTSPALLEDDQSQMKRKLLIKRRFHQQASKSMMLRMKSPPPVAGRKHEPVQTDLYLEELCEKPDELEIGTQTDEFVQRPSTPLYVSGKIGLDAETQIIPGDLFDFDIEVQPILEILVGKTIEGALIEVLEEEELAALREQQRRFLELRAADKAEQVRLEEEERRLRQEKDRQVEEHEKALIAQKETEERVAAAVLLTGYIAELLPAALEGLKISGFLLDEIRDDIKEDFIPCLMKQVKEEMGEVIASRELLMDMIKGILENRAAIYKDLGQQYDSSRGFTTRNCDVQSVDDLSDEFNADRRDTKYLNYQSPDLV